MQASPPHEQSAEILGAYNIPAFCRAFSLSRSSVYHEIKTGRLRRVKVGSRTLISYEAARDWLRILEQEG